MHHLLVGFCLPKTQSAAKIKFEDKKGGIGTGLVRNNRFSNLKKKVLLQHNVAGAYLTY